jgi:TonB family protein
MAAAVTVILFFAMAMLIKKEPSIGDPPPTRNIQILPKIDDTDPGRLKPVRPVNKEMPATPPPDRTKPPRGEGIPIGPNPGPGEREPINTKGMTGTILTYPPPYPEACRSKNAEGAVVVRYDVTDRGEVTNVRVISSANHCFDRTVVKTVLGWKYPPGAPRRDIEQSFAFTLEG